MGGDGKPNWVESYTILYKRSERSAWQVIKDDDGTDLIFSGNTNQRDMKTNVFPQPIEARFVRIVVQSYHLHLTLRVELLGCMNTWGEWKDGECSTTCGAGTIKSIRECPRLGECDGEAEKSTDCNKGNCASWSEWKDGECSTTCGSGTIKSTRECSGLGECDGKAENSTYCNKGICESWSEWKVKGKGCKGKCKGKVKFVRKCVGGKGC